MLAQFAFMVACGHISSDLFASRCFRENFSIAIALSTVIANGLHYVIH
jgi:hypothetical protein